MDIVADFLKMTLPAALVLYAVYLTVTAFLKKSFVEKQADQRLRQIEMALPIRLQAYERMCLFLERIAPNNLLMRLNGTATSASEFQQILLREVREEFNHNLSQQVYLSSDAWERIKAAQQEVIILVNQAAAEVSVEALPLDLSKKIFEKIIQENRNPTADALRFVKEEIQREFM
ncbi:MAG: hypothetical protein EAZ70_02495 [Runella slithyformis]|jgi:hypothetical protein|nr:MAG: hypothetical protein EAY79_02145 [Runella slithyformis]TAF94490.1 MAG: hypothetical protein EAZ46_10315 [Runella sp.]TAG18467.1 MAG: hypothetical protein EAZ38_14705 [Cytophagales bacterium]TAG39039.1 MAG: hypothetical protein EAZ32_11035 [Cytophagia bacterium]TAF29325.1 MAG: hypothetical protein EAZ70_02495 [Runella slithyformis]